MQLILKSFGAGRVWPKTECDLWKEAWLEGISCLPNGCNKRHDLWEDMWEDLYFLFVSDRLLKRGAPNYHKRNSRVRARGVTMFLPLFFGSVNLTNPPKFVWSHWPWWSCEWWMSHSFHNFWVSMCPCIKSFVWFLNFLNFCVWAHWRMCSERFFCCGPTSAISSDAEGVARAWGVQIFIQFSPMFAFSPSTQRNWKTKGNIIPFMSCFSIGQCPKGKANSKFRLFVCSSFASVDVWCEISLRRF